MYLPNFFCSIYSPLRTLKHLEDCKNSSNASFPLFVRNKIGGSSGSIVWNYSFLSFVNLQHLRIRCCIVCLPFAMGFQVLRDQLMIEDTRASLIKAIFVMPSLVWHMLPVLVLVQLVSTSWIYLEIYWYDIVNGVHLAMAILAIT